MAKFGISVSFNDDDTEAEGFAITVTFDLKPGTLAAFRALVDANARASMSDEPGCQRFDVLQPEGEADRVFLYEVYDDRDAFEAHKATPHYLAFEAGSRDMVAAKSVGRYDLVCEG